MTASLPMLIPWCCCVYCFYFYTRPTILLPSLSIFIPFPYLGGYRKEPGGVADSTYPMDPPLFHDNYYYTTTTTITTCITPSTNTTTNNSNDDHYCCLLVTHLKTCFIVLILSISLLLSNRF